MGEGQLYELPILLIVVVYVCEIGLFVSKFDILSRMPFFSNDKKRNSLMYLEFRSEIAYLRW